MKPHDQSVADGTADPAATLEQFSLAKPAGHLGEPDDITHLRVYRAPDESKFSTGQPLLPMAA